MYCRNCGRELQGSDAFCKYCGARQVLQQAQPGNYYGNAPVNTTRPVEITVKTRTSKAPWIILLVIIAALAAAAWFLLPTLMKSDEQQAREIVEDFFDSVKTGDTSGAIECFTPGIQEQYSGILSAGGMVLSAFGLPDVTGLVNPALGIVNQDYYQNYEFRVCSVTLDDDKKNGTVDVDVYVDGKKSQTTTIYVTKYRGKWYIAK